MEPRRFESDWGEARAAEDDPVLSMESLGRFDAVSKDGDCCRFGGGGGDCGTFGGMITAEDSGLYVLDYGDFRTYKHTTNCLTSYS